MSAKQKYIDSVDGAVHQSAVEIIEKLEAENKTLETKNLEITEIYNSMCDKRMELMGRYNDLKHGITTLVETK